MKRVIRRSIPLLTIAVLILALFPTYPIAEEGGQESEAAAIDAYRSQFHYSPSENWMNDPNGLVYFDGEYHLFYQHNPTGNQWGPMYWGHAISKDLINWEELPIALYPDEKGFIWSGSVVVDEQNTAGFQEGEHAAMVAVFTHEKAGHQTQSLAYSNDKGRTWTKYEGNPVIEMPEGTDVFRDPKVFWHEGTEKWNMVVSAGQSIEFYQSDNLKDWEHTDTFERPPGASGVWECPDLVELSVEGDGSDKKWVLMMSVSEGSSAGGSGMEYVVGDYNGESFSTEMKPIPLDYGADMYAGVTWNNLPKEEERTIMVGWMNNWQYGQDIPTEGFRGAMSIPRELNLRTTEEGTYRLQQQPVSELEQLRGETLERKEEVVKEGTQKLGDSVNDLLEITASFDIKQSSADSFGFTLKNENDQSTTIVYHPKEEKIALDRTSSGEKDFSADFAAVHEAPLEGKDEIVQLRILLDRSSVEVFGNEGTTVLTDQIFRDLSPSTLEIFSTGGEAYLRHLTVTDLSAADVAPVPTPVPEDVPNNLENGSFETGDLTGWTANGDAFSHGVSQTESYWDGKPFEQEGKYHLWGFSEDVNDSDFRTGTLQSDLFQLSGKGQIEFLIGGGQDKERLYVALVRASDGKELFKATGANDEKYRRVSWDASAYLGEKLYLKVVDYHTDGFGHINVDDFKVYAEGEPIRDDIENGDFETGDLTGWTVVEGDAFSTKDVTNDMDWEWGGPFHHQGDYHLWGAKDGGDGQTGILRSSSFILSGTGRISYLIGGGNDPDRLYAALVRAEDDQELMKATNTEWDDSEEYSQVVWDASQYVGEEVYLKIVDNSTEGWGHINVDDFQVKQTGLLAHWSFNEKEGKVTKEEVSGESDPVQYVFNDAVYKASSDPLWKPGLAGEALLFDGYSTWVTHADESFVQPEDALTIEGWVAPRAYEWGDLNQVSAIVNKHDKAKGEGFILGMGRHGKLSFQAGINGEWQEVSTKPEHRLEKDQWSYVAATFDRNDQSMKLYMNGALVGRTETPNGKLSMSSEDLLIGKHNQAALINGVFDANMFNGLIDEVKIANEAKTADEIQQEYQSMVENFPDQTLPEPSMDWDRTRYNGDQHRPQYHFMPPEHWMNEPHAPIYYNGKYHLFYQKNPQGPYWHHIHWGHAVSEDMVQWEELPTALAPDAGTVAPDGVWSGSATLDENGEPVLFFTAGDDSKFPNQMTGLAVSEDPEDPVLKEWRMLDEPVTVQEENLPAEEGDVMYGQFRDPFVWKDGDTWYQLMGSGIEQVGGTALLYSSKDLDNWTYEKPFFTGDAEAYPKTGDVWELPVFLPLGKDESGEEKYAFFINPWFDGYSPHNVKYTFYWVGTWDKETLAFVPDHEEPKMFDYGEHFTGPSGMVDEDGTPILFSIAQDKRSEQEHYDAGWAHNAGLPVELSLRDNNDLGLQPIKELEVLRGQSLVSFKNKGIEEANERIKDAEGDMLEIVLDIDPKQADKVGIKVRQSANGEEETLIYYDKTKETFAMDRNRSSMDPDVNKGVQGGELKLNGERWQLHLYLDRSMVEAYANGQKSITSRVYPTRYDALGIELWSEGGDPEIVSMDVWEMKGAFGEAAPVYEKETEAVPSHGELENHDFQTGDLTGWNIVEGDAFSDAHVTKKADWGWGGPFDQAEDRIDPERHHLWGFLDSSGGDAATGILESQIFELGGDGKIDFLIGGGSNIDQLSVSLVRTSDGKVLKEATGRNQETYHRVKWDASEYVGEKLLMRVTDKAQGGWGHINVDDVNVPVALSEEEKILDKLKEMDLQSGKDLDEKIEFYQDTEEKIEEKEAAFISVKKEMIDFLEKQLEKKRKEYDLSSIQLHFYVKHAIEETGARQPSDAGEVQKYVRKRVNKHATGKQVRGAIQKYLK
ncbi:hypothetical protein M662_07560 [Bacillus sp. SB49]|uniref:GH32 C-terminal domain-containing protein n=1 Tax=Bacillus sp. SB49 TaxID=1071080 RepID=UPI00040BE913|nr:GH32 C-terminal domain-containing protein [Bacillus sp. SB49]QHT46356.1 hypothetical protein M662_07560 [Bacillus sp. SB49]